MLGVNAPGLLLECATLTSSGDRERAQQEAGLRELAATIAERRKETRSEQVSLDAQLIRELKALGYLD
jgi:hypothetical protein